MNVPFFGLHADASAFLTPADIVSFRFPFPSAEDCRTRIARPCLVIDHDVYLGEEFVELLPGTASFSIEPEPSDIWLDQTAFFERHKESLPFRFIATFHERFHTKHPGFNQADDGNVIRLGRAFGSALEKIDHLRGQLIATRESHIFERHARRALSRRR